jgi:hypothetical protein
MPHGPYVSRATELPIDVLDPSDADDPPVHGCKIGDVVILKSLVDRGGIGLTELCWAAATAASASRAAAVAARIFF